MQINVSAPFHKNGYIRHDTFPLISIVTKVSLSWIKIRVYQSHTSPCQEGVVQTFRIFSQLNIMLICLLLSVQPLLSHAKYHIVPLASTARNVSMSKASLIYKNVFSTHHQPSGSNNRSISMSSLYAQFIPINIHIRILYGTLAQNKNM